MDLRVTYVEASSLGPKTVPTMLPFALVTSVAWPPFHVLVMMSLLLLSLLLDCDALALLLLLEEALLEVCDCALRVLELEALVLLSVVCCATANSAGARTKNWVKRILSVSGSWSGR